MRQFTYNDLFEEKIMQTYVLGFDDKIYPRVFPVIESKSDIIANYSIAYMFDEILGEIIDLFRRSYESFYYNKYVGENFIEHIIGYEHGQKVLCSIVVSKFSHMRFDVPNKSYIPVIRAFVKKAIDYWNMEMDNVRCKK